jgi:hypothetical protein
LADLGCLTALATAGISVAGDPVVNGAATAMDVLTAIVHVASGAVPGTVLSACSATLNYASQDAAGAIALIKGAPVAPSTGAVSLKAKAAPANLPKGVPPVPVVVHVPIR